MGRWWSGLSQQTVNLSPSGFGGSNPSLPTKTEFGTSCAKFGFREEEADCSASERDEKGGVMFREHAKPRAGVAEIDEWRHINYR